MDYVTSYKRFISDCIDADKEYKYYTYIFDESNGYKSISIFDSLESFNEFLYQIHLISNDSLDCIGSPKFYTKKELNSYIKENNFTTINGES